MEVGYKINTLNAFRSITNDLGHLVFNHQTSVGRLVCATKLNLTVPTDESKPIISEALCIYPSSIFVSDTIHIKAALRKHRRTLAV